MSFHHLLNIVTTILYLHNLCIIHGDTLNMDWTRKVEMEMQTKENGKLGDFQNKDMLHIACNTIKQMKRLQTSTMITEDVKDNTLNSSDDKGVDGGVQSEKEKGEIF